MTRAGSAAAIASAEPVEIPLGGKARLFLRGSIDRVDEAPDGSFHVWDYKTGSALGIHEGKGLRGGRQAQPALYAMAFDTLLARQGHAGRVSQSGYFFPGRKGEGQRVAVRIDPAETRARSFAPLRPRRRRDVPPRRRRGRLQVLPLRGDLRRRERGERVREAEARPDDGSDARRLPRPAR